LTISPLEDGVLGADLLVDDVLGVDVLAGGELAGWLVLSLFELLPQPATSAATVTIAARRPARDFANMVPPREQDRSRERRALKRPYAVLGRRSTGPA
jgi:hypothetical protein